MAIAFSALGTGGANQSGFASSISATGSQTVAIGDTVLIGVTSRHAGEALSAQTRVCTLGGVAATRIGSVEFSSGQVSCELWKFINTTLTGAQTTAASFSSTNNLGRGIVLNSVSYTGVGSVGAVSTNFANSSSPAVSAVVSAVGELVAGMFGATQTTFSAFSPTIRHADNTGDNFSTMVLGDGPGSSSVNLSATMGGSDPWGGIFARLIPPTSTATAGLLPMF